MSRIVAKKLGAGGLRSYKMWGTIAWTLILQACICLECSAQGFQSKLTQEYALVQSRSICPPNQDYSGFLFGIWGEGEPEGVKPILDDPMSVRAFVAYRQLNATCSCENLTLTANFSRRAVGPFTAFKQYIEGGEQAKVVGNLTYGLANVSCLDTDTSADVCELMGTANKYCPLIVYRERVVVIYNNITQQITEETRNQSNSIAFLQGEIDAFFRSFFNTNSYLYDSNKGIGSLANVFLWGGFLTFCLVSIVLQWISARRRHAQTTLLLLTMNSTFTMLGYLTMAFGHGRKYDHEAIFKTEQVEDSGSILFTGSIVSTPHVPPLFYARYVTWMASTPTSIFLLCDFANARRQFPVNAALDFLMILFGLIAALLQESQPVVAWFLYTLGMFAYSFLIHQFLGPILHAAVASKRFNGYIRLVVFIISSWSIYPLLWLLSDKGMHLLSTDLEVMLYIFLDMWVKLGFTFMLLNEYRVLARKERAPSAWAKSNGVNGDNAAAKGQDEKAKKVLKLKPMEPKDQLIKPKFVTARTASWAASSSALSARSRIPGSQLRDVAVPVKAQLAPGSDQV